MTGMRVAAIAVAAVILAALAFLHPAPRPALSVATTRAFPGTPPSSRPSVSAKRPPSLVVYVAGEVRNPGLYRVPAGARADDALKKAGGFSPHADRAGVNLAELAQDGQEIRVPAIGERAPRGRAVSPRKKRAKKSHARATAISLNDAGVDQLAQVPGLGRTLAERIVAYRAQNGPFASLDELADVSGRRRAASMRSCNTSRCASKRAS